MRGLLGLLAASFARPSKLYVDCFAGGSARVSDLSWCEHVAFEHATFEHVTFEHATFERVAFGIWSRNKIVLFES